MKPKPVTLAVSLTGAAAIVGAVMAQSQSKPSRPAERNSPSPAPRHAPRAATPRAAAALGTRLSPEERRRSDEISAHGYQIHLAAQALLREGKLEEAEKKCREEIAYYQSLGGRTTVNQLLGDIQLAQGKYQEALDTYAVVREHSDDTETWLAMSLCYIRLGKLDKAQEAFRACPSEDLRKLASDPPPAGAPGVGDLKSMELTLMLALSGVHSGDSPEALKYLLAAEKLAPENWEIVDAIGQRLDYMERYEEAIPYYRRALKLGGDKVSYHHRMRVEMYDLQKKQQASQRAPVAPSAPR